MLAAVARKNYEDRRRREAQGIVKAKAAGAYRGRPEDTARNAGIATMLRSGMSWTAHSGGDVLQPSDYRQGRQESGVAAQGRPLRPLPTLWSRGRLKGRRGAP
jgi:hypothetical protein